tara:strand:+ start:1459 stop:2091 length:633 start_codon:yes stop_codon:yes gene_type:complete
MISKQIKRKGILNKLIAKGLNILIRKECKKTGQIKIDIKASSIQIIKGVIPKIYIIAKDINYKDLLFEEIELEANKVKISLKIENYEFRFKNNFIIKFKISLSENSLKKILSSYNWNWIGNIISKEILNQQKLEEIRIKNDQIHMITRNEKDNINRDNYIDIKASNGSIYLKNRSYDKNIKIPIEEKVYIRNVNIENDLITILANSSVSF